MPCLQKIVEGCTPESIRLTRGSMTIGRGSGCDIIVLSPEVSKVHAKLTSSESGFVLEDVSTNGTLVNQRRIEYGRPYELHHGDLIRIGSTAFVFLRTDPDDDFSGSTAGRPRVVVMTAADSDPDRSIPRLQVRTGDLLPSGNADESQLSSRKLLAQIPLQPLPVLQLTTRDSVRRLSECLRLTEVLTASAENPAGLLMELLLDLFPGSGDVVLVQIPGISGTWRVLGAGRSDRRQTGTFCRRYVQEAVVRLQGLLIADQWRNGPAASDRMQTPSRYLILCAPLRTVTGDVRGAIQIIGRADSVPFTTDDLERLLVLGQMISPSLESLVHYVCQETPTAMGTDVRGLPK